MAVPPLRREKIVVQNPPDLPISALAFFPLFQILYLFVIPVRLSHTPGTSSRTFPTRFPSSKLKAGQGGSSLGTCPVLPAVPSLLDDGTRQ